MTAAVNEDERVRAIDLLKAIVKKTMVLLLDGASAADSATQLSGLPADVSRGDKHSSSSMRSSLLAEEQRTNSSSSTTQLLEESQLLMVQQLKHQLNADFEQWEGIIMADPVAFSSSLSTSCAQIAVS